MAFLHSEALYGQLVLWDTTVDDGDSSGDTLTEQSGSNRYLFMVVTLGYFGGLYTPSARNDSPLPATMTVGGQTLNIVTQAVNDAAQDYDDTAHGVYAANEATIAAMTFTDNEADWSLTLNTQNYTAQVHAVWYEDIDQTAGISDSDYWTGNSTPATLTLTTTSGDFVIGFASTRAQNTLAEDSGDTERVVSYSYGSGTNPRTQVTEETAAGASTSHTVVPNDYGMLAFTALVLTPAAAGSSIVVLRRRIEGC